jgi:hypothetical protein
VGASGSANNSFHKPGSREKRQRERDVGWGRGKRGEDLTISFVGISQMT